MFDPTLCKRRLSHFLSEGFWANSRRTGTSSLAPAEFCLRVPGFGILKFVSVRLTIPSSPDYVTVLLPPADKKCVTAMAKIAESFRQ
jgi:hypothetical protein